MTEFSWQQILVTVFGGGGVIVVLINLLTFLSGRLDKRREELKKAEEKRLLKAKEEDEKHTSLSVEMRRLEMDDRDRSRAEWLSIIENHKNRIQDLEKEIVEMRNLELLSRPVLKSIYAALRQVRRNLEKLDLQLMRREEHQLLAETLEILKLSLDELEKQVP